MYKDRDKQREANREASQRRRDKRKSMTSGPVVAQRYDDYGMTNEAIVIPDHPVPVLPKRGKDIKCFKDLPPDIQQTIMVMSRRDGKAAIAVHYQHLFPDRYYSTGIAKRQR